MKKFYTVCVILLGLSFGVSAHEIPYFISNNESHTPTTDFHRWVIDNDDENLHWHFGDGEAGGWDPCVAAAYIKETDSYALIDGNCGELTRGNGNNGNNRNSEILGNSGNLRNSENRGDNRHDGNNDGNGNNGNNGNEGNNGNNGNNGKNGNNGNGGNGNQRRSTGNTGSSGSSVLCEDDKGYSVPDDADHWPTAIVVIGDEEDEDEDDTETDTTMPPDPITKTSGESSDSTAYLTFTMTFPKGVNSLHLPFKPYTNFYFTDLFELLGDENVDSIAALRPTVQVWSIISSSTSLHDEWMSRYRGFLVDMEETVEVTFIRDAYNYGYDMIYLKDGMNLIGVPRNSEHLAIVSDFFVVFDCVAWIEVLIDSETQILYHPALESMEVESTLDGDTEISPTQGYMLMSLDDDEYPVWGDPWGEKTVPVASVE